MESRRLELGGLKPKDLVGIPWRVAFALQADGWYLRADVIWSKPNPMPESVTDRPTKAHEYVFLLARSERYSYDAAAILERAHQPIGAPKLTAQHKRRQLQPAMTGSTLGSNQGYAQRNCRSVWTLTAEPYAGAHFATMPPALVRRCILAGAPLGSRVLDPFSGSGTTVRVARELGREGIGLELSREYLGLARERVRTTGGLPFSERAPAVIL
jgi:DNA modification methylase